MDGCFAENPFVLFAFFAHFVVEGWLTGKRALS
jgi:hypothetical protein